MKTLQNDLVESPHNTTNTTNGQAASCRVAGQTRFDTIFEAILAKNILARQGGSAYSKDCLQSIERALALAADLVGKRDNQPNVESVWNQNVI